MKFLDFLLKIVALFSKITSENGFWSYFSLGMKIRKLPNISFEHPRAGIGVVLLGNIGPEP